MYKGLSAFIVGLFVISSANAAITIITTRSGGDSINWGQLNKADNLKFNTPISIKSYGGIDGSVVVLDPTKAPGHIELVGLDWNKALGTAELETQGGCSARGIYLGNFPAGDRLLLATPAMSLTISLKTPVRSIGAQLGAGTYGPFTARIQVFNKNHLLGSFTETGIVTTNADGSAIFLGVTDSIDEITSVVYTLIQGGGPGQVVINDVSINK